MLRDGIDYECNGGVRDGELGFRVPLQLPSERAVSRADHRVMSAYPLRPGRDHPSPPAIRSASAQRRTIPAGALFR